MCINLKKSKIQPFNFSRKYDFTPDLYIGQHKLEVVYETRLLGVIISSDCKWDAHVREVVKKGHKKMWFLRRLKGLGASIETLLVIYKLFVRQGAEIAAPVWSGALTKGNSAQLERLQRQATKVMCGGAPLDYTQRLERLSLENLDQRRLKITKKFATKMASDKRFSELFPGKEGPSTRNNQIYTEPFCKTRRYSTNPIVTFIKLLNQEAQKKQ